MPAEDVTVTGTFTTLFFFSKVKKLVVFFVLIRLIAVRKVSEWTEFGVIQEFMIEYEGVAFTSVVGERVLV